MPRSGSNSERPFSNQNRINLQKKKNKKRRKEGRRRLSLLLQDLRKQPNPPNMTFLLHLFVYLLFIHFLCIIPIASVLYEFLVEADTTTRVG